MRSVIGPILFLGFINVLYTENVVENITTEFSTFTNTKASSRYRDPSLSRMWPNRTSTSQAKNEERIKALALALRDADRVLNSKRSRKNEQSKKPRIFASPATAPEVRSSTSERTATEAPRGKQRLKSRIKSNGRYAVPSPILQPPYKSYSPEYDFEIDKPEFREATSTTTTDLPNNATIGRIKICDLTTAIPTSRVNINSSGNKNIFENFSNSNLDYTSSNDKQENYNSYNYEDLSSLEPLRIKLNTTGGTGRSRGSVKYQQNLDSNEISKRKDSISSAESGYNLKGRFSQQSNHFKLNGESSKKIGSIPGVPGRDYPVHQQYTHHHLRYPSSRFVCPVSPGTHIYLADRASRCQIFYVCYGEQTGVPMMCPNGTLFSEPLQVCDWWFNVVC
ncbi:uncharacterized protein LOC107274951 [Cephus cinctus]|uniref:Uncharacterized protein LOC107274951 n=1 Tax=Cephus cinctus TaxID=211228 RepID=A0AAJ7CH15_CEPCN|nr:uncharacterized protein LOC107274951 [Cephus cinctus]